MNKSKITKWVANRIKKGKTINDWPYDFFYFITKQTKFNEQI